MAKEAPLVMDFFNKALECPLVANLDMFRESPRWLNVETWLGSAPGGKIACNALEEPTSGGFEQLVLGVPLMANFGNLAQDRSW